jgi:hypothetical protein
MLQTLRTTVANEEPSLRVKESYCEAEPPHRKVPAHDNQREKSSMGYR